MELELLYAAGAFYVVVMIFLACLPGSGNGTPSTTQGEDMHNARFGNSMQQMSIHGKQYR